MFKFDDRGFPIAQSNLRDGAPLAGVDLLVGAGDCGPGSAKGYVMLSLGPAPVVIPAILGVAAVLIGLGRLRHDVVALLALAVAVWVGAVPAPAALDGFAEPAVAVLALLSVVGGAVRNSGVVDAAAEAIGRSLHWLTARLLMLGVLGTACSALMGSSAAMAAVLPAATQDRWGAGNGKALLLPLAVVCSLGGLVTAVGTVPNLLLDAIVQQGNPRALRLFDFAGTGITVVLAVLAVAAVAWPLQRRAARPPGQGGATAVSVGAYTSEVSVPPGSALVGQTVWTLQGRADGTVAVKAVVREGFRRMQPRPDLVIEGGDVLVLSCEPLVLQKLMARSGLEIVGAVRDLDPERVGVMEAVVTPASSLVGQAPGQAGLDERRLSLLAIGRSGRQPEVRLHRVKVQPGDVLVLQGELASMPGLLAGLGCLPLAGRRLRLARRRQQVLPGLALLAALGLAGSGTVPLVLALLAAAVLLVVSGVVTLDEAYAAVPWPVVVTAGALLPVVWGWGDGGAMTVARAAGGALGAAPDWVLVAGVIGLALLLAPWVTGVVAVLLVAPFAAALAGQTGLRAEGLLVAAAMGASFEVLPLPGRAGLVTLLGPGQTRWRDAGLLGMLFGATLVVVGTAAVLLVWPPR